MQLWWKRTGLVLQAWRSTHRYRCIQQCLCFSASASCSLSLPCIYFPQELAYRFSLIICSLSDFNHLWHGIGAFSLGPSLQLGSNTLHPPMQGQQSTSLPLTIVADWVLLCLPTNLFHLFFFLHLFEMLNFTAFCPTQFWPCTNVKPCGHWNEG